MTINDIPTDSILRHWLTYLNSTEVPFTYGVASGLSAIGAALRRNRWVDQFEWRVYPNQSVMFIGPSGVGKDTIINRALRTVELLQPLSHVPVLGGVTLESIRYRLAELPLPAAAVIPAPEMTAFFGKADYQQNMLTGVTDLLSNSDKIDISTKGALMGDPTTGRQGKPVIIWEPTVTMWAGSTVEWLHKSMPDGTLEGGFLGRFLITVEQIGGRHIPLVKSDKTKVELQQLSNHLKLWNLGVEECVRACAKPREVIMYEEAEHLYANWYHNRFNLFSTAVSPYANRSRDTVLRLAMLMAQSRQHHRWIDEVDVDFALKLISHVARRIDNVCLPPTQEALVARHILDMLPASIGQIYQKLGMRYTLRLLTAAQEILVTSGQVKQRGNTLHRVEAGKEGE